MVMAGWPSAAHDRLLTDAPRARHSRPGVPRRPLAVGRGGWGGFIPHAGPGQGLWHVGGVEVDAGLAGGSRGAMREQPGDDLDRHAAADQPGRPSIPGSVAVSSLLHAADRAEADQGSDRRNAAVSVPVAWRPRRRARAPGRRGRGQMPGSAGERRDGVADKREPGARPHGGRLVGRSTGPAAARAAGGQRGRRRYLRARRTSRGCSRNCAGCCAPAGRSVSAIWC